MKPIPNLYLTCTTWAIFFLVFLISQSCVDPFTPDVSEYENNIVIDARVLEGATPAEVKLTRTFDFGETEPEYVGGASVRIVDDAGGNFLLQEQEKGIYLSDTNQLVGIPGRSYQLSVTTTSGESYESDWQVMKKGAPIEEMYAQFEEKIVGFDTLAGMQVYISTGDPDNKAQYYQWEYEETWMYMVPFPATGVWDLATETPIINQDSLPWVCWGRTHSFEILLNTTVGLDRDVINDHPIRYITTETNRLRRRYSILVKQYVLNEEAYAFWENVATVNQELGTLFDPIPSQVAGNIRNLNEPSEPVLGYFSAVGFSSKRIFIDRLDFTPEAIVPSEYGHCDLSSYWSPQQVSAQVRAGRVFVARLTDMQGNIVGYTVSSLECADCRVKYNGTTKMPDFWR